MAGLDQVIDAPGCFEGGNVDDAVGLVLDRRGRDLDRNGHEALMPLASMIERDIIPRLMLSHRNEAGRPPVQELREAALPPQAVERLTRTVMTADASVAMHEVATLRESGVPLETIFLDLLAPAARRLGDMWLADQCGFTDVTIGLCRLQQVLRAFGRAFEDEVAPALPGQRILLAATPSEQHSFGILMVDEFFRRAHWDVTCLAGASEDELLDEVRRGWFAAVGLSASCEHHMQELKGLIAGLRRRSRNPSLVILVGGQCFSAAPDLAKDVGADGAAVDGRQAIGQLHKLLRGRP